MAYNGALTVGDWYYIGHYGQLGPLTRDQIEELVQSGVIGPETYVWRTGMESWRAASDVTDFASALRVSQPFSAPPPPPSAAPPVQRPSTDLSVPAYYPTYGGMRSDRSRTAAGVLQLFLPGVGRMYLGYVAYGVLQLVTALCGVGILWSFIDGIVILSGGMKLDGYGRQLSD